MKHGQYMCHFFFEPLMDTKYFDELNKLNPTERTVRRFEHMLEDIPVHLHDDDTFFGWFGFTEKPTGYKRQTFDNAMHTPEEIKAKRVIVDAHKTRVEVDRGHVCADYEAVLTKGLCDFEKRIDKELEAKPDNEMLKAMKRAILATKAFSERLSKVALEKANASEGETREKFLAISAAVAKVPYQPAETFLEAIQSVWLIHTFIPMASNSWFSVSLGRFDRYMLPYYRKALAEGMTKEQIREIMYNFYCLLNSYADGACALNVGGYSDDGVEYNELSKFIIECQRDFGMPGPILAARITKDTPDEIMAMLVDEKLFSRGQPTFYFEESVIEALVEKGIPREKAVNYAANTCMEIGLPGEEMNSAWGVVMGLTVLMERTVDSAIESNGKICDRESLMAEFLRLAEEHFNICADVYEADAARTEHNKPDVFLSAITAGCIERGADRVSGANYHNAVVECMGMVNAADAMAAIDHLVFKNKKYTLEQLREAVKANFVGYEQIHADLLAAPKFGLNNKEADSYTYEMAEALQKIIRKRDRGNLYYKPSLHTLDHNVRRGKELGAGYDGRVAGDPLAKNAGPSNCVRCKSPTNMILSVSALPQKYFYGGQPLDIYFNSADVRNQPMKIAAAVRVYGQRGGIQLQVNSLSSETLREAIARPEDFEDLVVRIGGYSCYFNELTADTKEEFVYRHEKEEQA